MLVVTIDTLALSSSTILLKQKMDISNSSIFSILHNPSMDQPNKTQRLLFNLHLNLLSTDSTVTDVVYLCQPVTELRMIMINHSYVQDKEPRARS